MNGSVGVWLGNSSHLCYKATSEFNDSHNQVTASINIFDTSRRQVLYLKSKITKLGAPEAFRTIKICPLSAVNGWGGGGYR